MNTETGELSNVARVTQLYPTNPPLAGLPPFDLAELSHRAHCNYERIRDLPSEAARNYYTRNGYDERRSSALLDLVKKLLAVSAAWHSMGIPVQLRPPERLKEFGWQGLVAQTRDYAAIAQRMSMFIHHTTDPVGLGGDTEVTRAVLLEIFGPQDMDLWA